MKQYTIQLTQIINKKSNKMKKFFCFFAALFVAVSLMAANVTDVLNNALTGVTGTNYTEWSNKTSNSSAVYAGQSAGGYSSIQLRSNNSNSGVITTASGGTLVSITVKFNSNTSNARTLDIYADNTAYTSPTQLYGTPKGTKVAGITMENGAEQTYTFTDAYQYIAFRSNSGALYLDEVDIVWSNGEAGDTTSQDTTPVIVPVTMEALTFNANIWNVADVNEKYAAWVWGDNLEGMWTDFFTPLNAENMYGAQIPETADSIVFVRLDNAIDTVTWNNIWNQTVDYAINHADMYFTVEGWGEGENAKSYGTWGTPVVYNTCADVNNVTENTNMTLNEVTVVFIKGSNIYVKDATGTTLVYTNAYSDLVPGDRVSGIAGQAKLYNGLPELAASTAFADLTVVPGDAPVIFDAQAAPTAANVNEVMMFRGVQMPTASFTTARATNINGTFAGEQVAFRNNWKEAFDFDSTKTYTMLGCVAIYNGSVQVYVTNIEEEVVPVQRYYIKNNWNGGSAWTWEEMSPVENNVLYEYTGVFGGSGVNINTMASDDGYTWFPVADFRTIDSTYVPQALDTIHFVYSIVDSALAVELVGRPAPAPVQYYIKNNWNGGSEWTWEEMSPVENNVLYEYTGVFGGTGVDVNTMASDAGSTWFSVADFRTIDSTYVPQALDTIHFVYSILDSALAVELVGRPEPIIIDSVTTILNITDVTGWENLYVYAWGGAEIFGSWPGEIALEQIIISGNYEGQTEHLIFNNGAGTQLADFDIVLMDTVYNIVVRADGAYFPEDVPTTNTCAEVNAITEATDMTLGEVTVVFAKGSNIYVQDATATTLVYTNKYADLVPGDRVQGIAGQAKLFNGLPELAATTEFADLVVTAGQAPRIPDAKTAPTMADINKVMMFRNVTMLDSAFTTPNNKAMNINGIFNGDTVTFRNNWKDTYTFEQGKTYTMLGCVAVYNNAIQVYVTNIEEYVEVPVQYYIKNNWNGGSAWTWEEMSPVLDNVLYEYTGVFGGTGVNINTMASDDGYTWFPVEKFSLIDSTYVPQALDTIHFVYSIVDATLAVELVGRPAGDSVLHYYIKNNWEAGSEWTWVEMDMVVDSAVYEYTGVFGGTGVNINTMATDAGAIWFPVEDFRTIDSTYVPQALDTIHFVYSIVDSALAVELVGRPVIEEIQYYIKNNWNGGEWTWEEMTPANDGNITWTYRGIFGGTGVNINNLPIDADAIWFPVDEWLFTTLGYVPEAGDDIIFEFDSELLTLTATFMGKDGLETITFQREGETMKLIHNGQLYIIRDGKMYNALGAQVR